MKILVFTEGTILTPKISEGLNRDEVVEQSRREGIQREEAFLQFESKGDVPVEPNSVHDYSNYIPVGNAVQKLTGWKNQSATICYLTSRQIKLEVETIKSILKNMASQMPIIYISGSKTKNIKMWQKKSCRTF